MIRCSLYFVNLDVVGFVWRVNSGFWSFFFCLYLELVLFIGFNKQVTVAYNKDPSPNKLNLGVGAYRTEVGLSILLHNQNFSPFFELFRIVFPDPVTACILKSFCVFFWFNILSFCSSEIGRKTPCTQCGKTRRANSCEWSVSFIGC